MSFSILIALSVFLMIGNTHGGFLSSVPTTTLAVSSPLVSRSFLSASPYYQYSSVPQNILTYASYGSVLGGLSSPYVAAPAYYKYAFPSYVAPAPASIFLNPSRTVVEPAVVAEEVPVVKEATPEPKDNDESDKPTSDDAPTQE